MQRQIRFVPRWAGTEKYEYTQNEGRLRWALKLHSLPTDKLLSKLINPNFEFIQHFRIDFEPN